MKGVILFADDQVFETGSNEYKLFHKFNSDSDISVLPINTIDVLEKTVSSISTYRALILDWNFKRQLDNEDYGVKILDDTPVDILKNFPIYSIVYVYSQNPISDTIKTELKELFHDKIFFEQKNNSQDTNLEFNKIINTIKQFEENNKHMSVPFIWSQAINKSAQKIFYELELCNTNWIREIYNTAKEDGIVSIIEVINVFNNLLNELIIQNENLINEISNYVQLYDDTIKEDESSAAKLYSRIYYTKLLPQSPYMTGDIFKFDENEYGILFTPECDIGAKKDYEFLLFKKTHFDTFLQSKKDYLRNQYTIMMSKKKQKEDLLKQFNNDNISYHILPSFPFINNEYNLSVYIDFKNAFIVKTVAEYDGKRTEYKLNSPYIYQLRQRYLAYIGRVGVPKIPESLKLFNLR